jgi:hypothetical protein
MPTRPERDEAAPYYFTYIDLVPSDDICRVLERQGVDALAGLQKISEETSLQRYQPGKWSIRELVGHINDTERLCVSRAFWFARGFETPLPSFDQNVAVAAADAQHREWASLIEEFRSVRAATLSFFQNLPADAWSRRGVASDNPFSVRALAYLAAGHVTHHLNILRERYPGVEVSGRST